MKKWRSENRYIFEDHVLLFFHQVVLKFQNLCWQAISIEAELLLFDAYFRFFKRHELILNVFTGTNHENST